MPDQLIQFLQQPFSANMPATRWFLFLGLILVSLWGWHMIFRELHEVEGSIT